jgi:hypothetical protein
MRPNSQLAKVSETLTLITSRAKRLRYNRVGGNPRKAGISRWLIPIIKSPINPTNPAWTKAPRALWRCAYEAVVTKVPAGWW